MTGKNKKTNKMKKVMISIKGLPVFAESDDDAFELMTDGEYLSMGEYSTLRYPEGIIGIKGLNATIESGQLTTFDIEPDRIIMRRGADDGTDMIFSEKQKHQFLYNTPGGFVTMGIDTYDIKKNLNEDGGDIEIRYDIEIENIAISRNLFKININKL